MSQVAHLSKIRLAETDGNRPSQYEFNEMHGTPLAKTEGKLTTFELDPHRAALAREHFKKAQVDQLVTFIEGDAHQNVTSVKGPIDIVFIDADKGGYVDYLNKVVPLLRPGGLILAHNINMVPEYVKAVTTNRDLETAFYMEGNQLGITIEKR